MLHGIPAVALAAALWLTACTGSRERAQETPAPEPTVQETVIPAEEAAEEAAEDEGGSTQGVSRSDVPSDPTVKPMDESMQGEPIEETKESVEEEGTQPTEVPSTEDEAAPEDLDRQQEEREIQETEVPDDSVQESEVPGVGHGSGVPGYDPTEDPTLEEEAGEPDPTLIPAPAQEQEATPSAEAEPASPAEPEADDAQSEDVSPTEIPADEQTGGQESEEFQVAPESGVLQPEDGAQDEGAPTETVIPSEENGGAPYVEQPQRHSDFGRQVQEREIIPDSTTEQSGMPEGVEQQD